MNILYSITFNNNFSYYTEFYKTRGLHYKTLRIQNVWIL